MDNAILAMLEAYKCTTKSDFENALKEIIQEIALLGLWRSKFFEHALFYDGTALRILYGLNRFSEDLDFSLLKPQKKFNMNPYLKAIEYELQSFGFDVSLISKVKTKKTSIESAFIKANTYVQLIKTKAPEGIVKHIQGNEILKIKIEVDMDPPEDFSIGVKNLLQPIPFQVKTMSLESLFAGKMHAVLARKWKTRVKGRDFYDMLWYIGRNTHCDLNHLRNRLVQSGDWNINDQLNEKEFRTLLKSKLETVNYELAKKDVAPFLNQRESESLQLWNLEYFLDTTSSLKII